jgi:serine/threonine protein kinase
MQSKGYHTKNYNIGKVLGKGGFGEVRVGIDKRSQQARAIKYIKTSGVSEK